MDNRTIWGLCGIGIWLPETLVAGWNKRQGHNFYNDIRVSIVMSWVVLALLICGPLTVICIGFAAGGNYRQWIAGGLLLAVLLGLVYVFCKGNHQMNDDLTTLCGHLGIDWKSLILHPDVGYKTLADRALIYEAGHVLCIEKKHGKGSTEYDQSRAKFRQRFEICARFGLADENWNRYFDEASKLSSAQPVPKETDDIVAL